MEFCQIEPFGAPYEDLRAGVVASVVANVNRDPKKRPEPFGPLDLLPWARPKIETESEVIDLGDDKAQSDLIVATMFGKAPS